MTKRGQNFIVRLLEDAPDYLATGRATTLVPEEWHDFGGRGSFMATVIPLEPRYYGRLLLRNPRPSATFDTHHGTIDAQSAGHDFTAVIWLGFQGDKTTDESVGGV